MAFLLKKGRRPCWPKSAPRRLWARALDSACWLHSLLGATLAACEGCFGGSHTLVGSKDLTQVSILEAVTFSSDHTAAQKFHSQNEETGKTVSQASKSSVCKTTTLASLESFNFLPLNLQYTSILCFQTKISQKALCSNVSFSLNTFFLENLNPFHGWWLQAPSLFHNSCLLDSTRLSNTHLTSTSHDSV